MLRTRRFISFIVVAATLLLGVLQLSGVIAVAPKPHEADCVNCHLAGDKVTQANAHQLLSSQEVLCGQCHENALRLSHATGFTPTRELSKEYPLDWKGDVTCSTCHDLHSGNPGLIRGSKRGREFCLSCHSQRFFAAMPDGGTSIIDAGHLEARANPEPMVLDPFSTRCLGCHSDKAEGGPLVNLDARGIVRHSGNGVNHPLGMDYSTSARFGGYRPKGQLSKVIFLPKGRMGCISCHKGYTKKHGELVMSNRGSGLCFECHDL